jgi:hypothetical protein
LGKQRLHYVLELSETSGEMCPITISSWSKQTERQDFVRISESTKSVNQQIRQSEKIMENQGEVEV